mgnify:FL=1
MDLCTLSSGHGGSIEVQVNIREARAQLSRLLKAVERGERVEITRRGKVVARLALPEQPEDRLQRRKDARAALRDRLPPAGIDSATLVRALREERG